MPNFLSSQTSSFFTKSAAVSIPDFLHSIVRFLPMPQMSSTGVAINTGWIF